jgi:hypothetical protein
MSLGVPTLLQYLDFLTKLLVLPRGLRVAAAPNQLLDLEDGRLGFKLSGTTDCVVVDGEIERTIGMADALRAIIELKKAVSERDLKQAVAELISADLHATALRPFAVVTDLKDDWRFMWLRGERTIRVLRAPAPSAADPFASRRCASLFLRRLLADGTGEAAERQQATQLLEALPIPIAKRKKLSPVKERTGRGDEFESAAPLSDSDEDDVDGPGWGEEDRRQVLFRQVRQMIRHTPWLQEVCRPPLLSSGMSAEARSMFG